MILLPPAVYGPGALKSLEKGLAGALKAGGLIGSPVVGVRVIVDDGDTHAVDSKDIAFQTCARDAFRKVYPAAKPVVLEPLMRVGVEGPEAPPARCSAA